MSVIPLTILISVALTALFIALFAREMNRNDCSSAERESLLPLADEQSRHAPPTDSRSRRVR